MVWLPMGAGVARNAQRQSTTRRARPCPRTRLDIPSERPARAEDEALVGRVAPRGRLRVVAQLVAELGEQAFPHGQARARVRVQQVVSSGILERGQVLELVVEVQRIDGGPVHRVGQPRGDELLGRAVLEVLVDPRHTGLGREIELGPLVPLVAHADAGSEPHLELRNLVVLGLEVEVAVELLGEEVIVLRQGHRVVDRGGLLPGIRVSLPSEGVFRAEGEPVVRPPLLRVAEEAQLLGLGVTGSEQASQGERALPRRQRRVDHRDVGDGHRLRRTARSRAALDLTVGASPAPFRPTRTGSSVENVFTLLISTVTSPAPSVLIVSLPPVALRILPVRRSPFRKRTSSANDRTAETATRPRTRGTMRVNRRMEYPPLRRAVQCTGPMARLGNRKSLRLTTATLVDHNRLRRLRWPPCRPPSGRTPGKGFHQCAPRPDSARCSTRPASSSPPALTTASPRASSRRPASRPCT